MTDKTDLPALPSAHCDACGRGADAPADAATELVRSRCGLGLICKNCREEYLEMQEAVYDEQRSASR